ncbi:MAG: hypothetical protein Kow0098_07990 [Ignavibacteriaceae bacterium]
MKFVLGFVVFLSLSFMLLIILPGCSTQDENKELTGAELIKRGEYIVNTSGCNDCHTPKVFTEHGMALDTTRLLSGHPEGTELYQVDPSMVGPGKWILTNDHLTAWVGPWEVRFLPI